MKIELGHVGHMSFAVRDPARSAEFWTRNFDLKEIFRFEDGVAIGNDAITLAFFKGTPDPDAIDHVSFHVENMKALRAAVEQLKKDGADLEDPGEEIGPEAPDSPHMGLWFHDADGYRWELSVQNGANES